MTRHQGFAFGPQVVRALLAVVVACVSTTSSALASGAALSEKTMCAVDWIFAGRVTRTESRLNNGELPLGTIITDYWVAPRLVVHGAPPPLVKLATVGGTYQGRTERSSVHPSWVQEGQDVLVFIALSAKETQILGNLRVIEVMKLPSATDDAVGLEAVSESDMRELWAEHCVTGPGPGAPMPMTDRYLPLLPEDLRQELLGACKHVPDSEPGECPQPDDKPLVQPNRQ